MKVYVVEVGSYDQRGIQAVYSTLRAAMSSRPSLVDLHYEPDMRAWTDETGDGAYITVWQVEEVAPA